MQQVPTTYSERQRIRTLIENLPLKGQPVRQQLEAWGKSVIENEKHLAWTMVLIGSRLWKQRVANVPFTQRLLLLPHCLRPHYLQTDEKCRANYNSEGLQCQKCGACELGNLKSAAEKLGYRVLIAEGSPVVMQWILSGKVNAILGVGCLHSLEKAFEKLQLAGIPAMAVPLHNAVCKDSMTDIDWVYEMIHTPFEPADPKKDAPPTYIHLLRGAAKLFGKETAAMSPNKPSRQTEALASDFAARGGKFYRPFITLAVYDALTGSNCTGTDGEQQVEKLPRWVKNAAKTIEIFHKASLIHDDIEDGDLYRYGQQTLHQSHGTASAINVGDYLIGYGYQSIAELRKEIPNSIVAEMLAVLSTAHCKLCVGQGTELAWKDIWKNKGENPTAEDVLRFYVGKTSPAFEAALKIGVLLAVAAEGVNKTFYDEVQDKLARFSRHLGAAFQIKNDLDDWFPDQGNKKIVGTDLADMRPTLLHAWMRLDDLPGGAVSISDWFEHFQQTGLFDQARRLAAKYSDRARETVQSVTPPSLRTLLLHFVEALGMS